jgi:pimeloyl-ACP methyl ester carboxylesterase
MMALRRGTLVCLIALLIPFLEAYSAMAAILPEYTGTTYNHIKVDGLDIFYREAGPRDAPCILLLHGYPSSSRMFDPLLPLLSGKYHLIAPDYPGFGLSEAPPPANFAYTFEHIAKLIDDLTTELGLSHYALYLQDYGGPIGFCIAVEHPERIQTLIIQNAVVHEEGLSPVWAPRRAYWANRAEHEPKIREALLSVAAGVARHVGPRPNLERFNPDLWMDEIAFLKQPGEDTIQLSLMYDYQTNVAAYAKWQAYLRDQRPPTLVVWGKFDPIFTLDGAHAINREVPSAEVHILDAGHFALEERAADIAVLIDRFLVKNGIGK